MLMNETKKAFNYHWGSGFVAEEARIETPHHVPTIQLLQYTDGPEAGKASIRFCQYNLRGRFMRSPMVISTEDIDEMRAALDETPELKSLLKRLVS